MDKVYTDEEIMRLWEEMEDIPYDPEKEEIEVPFLHFPSGTDRDTIWHWFDEHYTGGLYALMTTF